jgi:hypothetical protein
LDIGRDFFGGGNTQIDPDIGGNEDTLVSKFGVHHSANEV